MRLFGCCVSSWHCQQLFIIKFFLFPYLANLLSAHGILALNTTTSPHISLDRHSTLYSRDCSNCVLTLLFWLVLNLFNSLSALSGSNKQTKDIFKVEFKPSLDYLKQNPILHAKRFFLRFKPQAPAHERDPSRPTIKGTRGIKVIRQWQSFGRGGPRWPPLPGGISDRGLGWRRFPSFEEGRRIWAGDRGPNMGNWLTPRRETKTRRGHTIHSLRPNPLRRARGQTHIFLRILTTSLFVTCL